MNATNSGYLTDDQIIDALLLIREGGSWWLGKGNSLMIRQYETSYALYCGQCTPDTDLDALAESIVWD